MDKRTGRFAAAAILVGIAGYITGVLTAPKSGKDTRKDIKDAASSKAAEAEKQLKNIHTDLTHLINKATDKASGIKGKAKQEFDHMIEKAKQAKNNTRQAISSVREGETEDKDLQASIDEAEKAVEHLKKYLKK